MKSFVCVLLIVLSLPALAIAQGPGGQGDAAEAFSSADRQILLGDTRYYEGDYYRAITAYRDFLWAHPGDVRAHRVRMKMAWMYHLAGDQREAARQLNRVVEEHPDDVEGMWAQLYLGRVAARAEQIPLARRAFEGVLDLCAPRLEGPTDDCLELVTQARLALADVSASRHEFQAATGHLRLIPPESPFYQEGLEIADRVDGLRIPRKSPALAGTLSIIPGLGHFYIGEYGNGVLAMVWNGLFIYGLVDSIMARRFGQAAVIGLLESIWYGGTIFGAIAGAQRYNRDARRIVEDGLRRQDLQPMIDDTPWPARFPASPGHLELHFEF